MNRTFLLLMCAVSVITLVATAGCGGRRRGGPGVGTDGGPITVDGGGVDLGPGVDLGGIMFDLGPMVDLGRDMGRDMGSSCTPEVIDYVAGPYCSAATQTCVDGCTTGTCLNDCLDADASPDCSACAQQNLLACANDNGCLSQWGSINCCLQANCPTGSASTCADTYCPSELSAYTTCANDVLPTASCTNDYTSCF